MGESFCLTVNGVERCTSEDRPLLRYPRDDLHLHSVRDRCSEGTCGTCTIVVGGKTVKSCILTTRRAVDENTTTTEGLNDAEKEAFMYVLGVIGSVQCGFCTPGTVMARKALIDRVPDPTEEEIKVALRGNTCHCTGYKRTIEGIQLTAVILRSDVWVKESLKEGDEYDVGERTFRLDVREKVLGCDECPDDVVMEGMVYASVVCSRYLRARVLNINYEKAAALPDVLAVLTVGDVPNNGVGHLQQDWDIMVAKGDITRCVGDAICLVVAESRNILEKAKEVVKIDCEESESVCSVQEAMAEGAPKVHKKRDPCQSRHATRGNAKRALENSRHVVAQTYRTPFIKHAFLEPGCAVASPYRDGMKVYSTDQGIYDTRKEISIMLGWGPDRVVVENKLVGGGLGSKEDVSTQHMAALTAFKVQRSVKTVFSRRGFLSFHPKCHTMEGTFILGCDENGIPTGLDCEIYLNTGAYASLCGLVLERACTHSVGPYCYQNADIRDLGYYTNNPPAGALRGFGVYQNEFAPESSINLLAEKVGISPWEIRYRNAIEPGKVLPNGQITDCLTTPKETLLAVKNAYESNSGGAGIACAMKNAGVDVGLPDKSRAKLAVHDGKTELYSAIPDIGQGYVVVFVQMISETTSPGERLVRNMGANSEVAPDSGITSGFRQTLITGEAIRMAAADLNEALQEVGGDLSQLEGREFLAEFFDPTDKLKTGVPNPKNHVTYGFTTHVVALDDDGRVKKMYAAHDSGGVVSLISIQRQIEGGVLMGLDYALTKGSPLKNDILRAKCGTLGLMRFTQILGTHAIYVEKEELLPSMYGVKGAGEVVTIPTALTAQGAYYAKDHILWAVFPMDDTYYSKKK